MIDLTPFVKVKVHNKVKRAWYAPLNVNHKWLMALVNIALVASGLAFVVGLALVCGG